MAKFLGNLIEVILIAATIGPVVGLTVAAVAYYSGSDEATVNSIGNCVSVLAGGLAVAILGVRK